MSDQHILIIGGGLAGLSTGCYARMNGWRTTIVEHNLALGGVCAAWQRGPYTIDGCIQWLTGGPFMRIYEELKIIPSVGIRTLEHFATYTNLRTGATVALRGDLDTLRDDLTHFAGEDVEEIDRIIDGAAVIAGMDPGIDPPPELATIRDRLHTLWEMRGELGTMFHFRKSMGEYAQSHLVSEDLRRLIATMLPDEAPAFFLLFLLGYLGTGRLSRPIGGTAAFRDALVHRYTQLGGDVLLHTTVEEVVVDRGRARGVRLTDGTIVEADIVVSTASAPETILRLLASEYGADALHRRLNNWKLFQPIVMVSYGVDRPYSDHPSTLIVDGVGPLLVGGREDGHVTVRIFNDEPSVGPEGHTVVQVLAPTDYEWWATRGTRYGAEKELLAETIMTVIDPVVPGLREAVRMTDVATPLTFWRNARSWRGAFEGWLPTPDSFYGHVEKSLPGLDGFYMAGQWVQPGGGVPTALMSGRQLVQILCDAEHREFVPGTPTHTDAS